MNSYLADMAKVTTEAEAEQVRFDANLLRAQKALDFRDPTRRMFGKIEGEVWDFFANTAMDSGYNFREGQYDMAEGVLKAIQHRTHLAVEAGVGIGKSFGYLVPLLLYHLKTARHKTTLKFLPKGKT